MLDKPKPRSDDARQRAIEEFYLKYKSAIERYFLRRVHNRAEAEDLTQDLLIRITQQMDRSEIEKPDVFLFTVAANLLRDRGRHLKRVSRNVVEFEHRAKNAEVLSPERVLGDRQALASLLKHLKAFASVNPRACNVFLLHRVEGLKHAEIAQIYGIGVSTVEKDIMRAVAYIAKCSYDFRE